MMPPRITAALCTYVVRRTGIGDYILNPVTRTTTFSLDEAHAWLWPASETKEQRDARLTALKMPFAVMAVRSRP